MDHILQHSQAATANNFRSSWDKFPLSCVPQQCIFVPVPLKITVWLFLLAEMWAVAPVRSFQCRCQGFVLHPVLPKLGAWGVKAALRREVAVGASDSTFPPPLMVCPVLFSAILVHSSWGIRYAVLQVCASFLWYEGSWVGLQVFLIEGGKVWAPWGAWWLLRLSPLLPVSWSSSEATLLHHNQQENVPVWAAY